MGAGASREPDGPATNSAPPQPASTSESACPVPSAYRNPAVYNVYNQRVNDPACPIAAPAIDPRNNMPVEPNQLPAPGQRKLISTARAVSEIPKGGTESTWVYPSPQMFYNGRCRSAPLSDRLIRTGGVCVCARVCVPLAATQVHNNKRGREGGSDCPHVVVACRVLQAGIWVPCSSAHNLCYLFFVCLVTSMHVQPAVIPLLPLCEQHTAHAPPLRSSDTACHAPSDTLKAPATPADPLAPPLCSPEAQGQGRGRDRGRYGCRCGCTQLCAQLVSAYWSLHQQVSSRRLG